MDLFEIIDTQPLAVLTAAIGALLALAVILIEPRWRRLWLAVLVLLPASPIFVVRLFAMLVVLGCDWLVRDRAWARPLADAAEIIDRELAP